MPISKSMHILQNNSTHLNVAFNYFEIPLNAIDPSIQCMLLKQQDFGAIMTFSRLES